MRSNHAGQSFLSIFFLLENKAKYHLHLCQQIRKGLSRDQNPYPAYLSTWLGIILGLPWIK